MPTMAATFLTSTRSSQDDRGAKYVPTPEGIIQARNAIRDSWSDHERAKRLPGGPPRRYEFPTVLIGGVEPEAVE
ncbi:MAG: hypothetical protein ACR2NM_08850 [Bythopirellula sp.]